MFVKINTLRPHPAHKEIYGVPKNIIEVWKDLYISLKSGKRIVPLIVTKDGIIISGVRRWLIGKALGWTEIEVEIISVSEEEAALLLVEYNFQREKTEREKINEVLHMGKIIGNRQGKRDLPNHQKGDRCEIVSKKMGKGYSKENVRKLFVLEKEDKKSKSKKLSLISLAAATSIDKAYRHMEAMKLTSNNIAEVIRTEMYSLQNKSCQDGLSELEDGTVKMFFISPPYWDLREYEDNRLNQFSIGNEKTVEEYCEKFKIIGLEIKRVLREDGVFYLNIGETFREGKKMGIPEKLFLAMEEIGFISLNDIIWYKTNAKPGTSPSGLKNSYEHIYVFAKNLEKYNPRKLKWKKSKSNNKISGGVGDRKNNGERLEKGSQIESPYVLFNNFYDENAKYADIIRRAVASSKHLRDDANPSDDHPAVFHETLPLLPLLQSTYPNDLVVDCFSGSATLGVVSILFGRKYLGIELNKTYHEIASKRLERTAKLVSPKMIEMFEKKIAA